MFAGYFFASSHFPRPYFPGSGSAGADLVFSGKVIVTAQLGGEIIINPPTG